MTSQSTNHVTNVLLLGNAGIGKSSLARTITEGVFPAASSLTNPSGSPVEYQTTAQTSIHVGDACHVIHIYDVIDDHSKDQGTQQQLPQKADVVYLCFDVSSQATFDAIQTIWLPKAKMLTKGMKNKPQYILIGLKTDQIGRLIGGEPSSPQPITAAVANELANQIQAFMYVEVSSLKYLGIEKVKEQTVFCVNKTDNPTSSWPAKKSNKCRLM